MTDFSVLTIILPMDLSWKEFTQTIDRAIGHRLRFPAPSSLPGKLCIACSGGIDSLCLTLAIAAKFEAQQLTILHYNHGTRGQETDDDEAFVQKIAQNLGIEFFTEKRSHSAVTEEALRNARYDFFSRIMDKLGSKYLLLAHQADDVIETILMRLARGSSEIAAPKYCQQFPGGVYRIRPLISIFKQEIIDLFKKNQIPWREDSSNPQSDYLRNRIRQFIPQWDPIFKNRHWKQGFLLAHRYLEEDSICLNQMAEALCSDPQKLDLQNVPQLAIIRRAIQFWLCDSPLTRPCFEEILEAIVKNLPAKITINPTTSLEIDRKILHRILKSTNDLKINFKNWRFGTLYLPTGFKLTREIVPFSPLNIATNNLNSSVVYIDRTCMNISVRSWQHGDHYRPINASTKSLKKLFSEKKIPAEQRSKLPVLCTQNGSILWVPHAPPAHSVKVENNFALKITFSST